VDGVVQSIFVFSPEQQIVTRIGWRYAPQEIPVEFLEKI